LIVIEKRVFILAEGIHPSSYLLERKPCFYPDRSVFTYGYIASWD